nr:uncharacterized protein LOC107391653 isoform X3 [Nothobranchius furzeri]
MDSAKNKRAAASSTSGTPAQTPNDTKKPRRVYSSEGKRAKLECDRRRQRTRINIGPAFEKWKMLRESLRMKTDPQLALFLLKSHQSKYTTSTPLKRKRFISPTPVAALTSIHGESSEREPEVDSSSEEDETIEMDSGDEDYTPYIHISYERASAVSFRSASDRMSPADTPQGDISVDDFNDLQHSLIDWDHGRRHPGLGTESVSSSEDEEVDPEHTDSEEEDFGPPICVRTGGDLRTNWNLDQIPTISLEDTVHDAYDQTEEPPSVETPSVTQSLNMDVEDDLIGQSASITYLSSLKQLVEHLLLPVSHCPAENPNTKEKCRAPKPFRIQIQAQGTASAVEWFCPNGHTVWKWTSQPTAPAGFLAGDFMLACNILLSGNYFSKIALLFKFMNMGMVSAHNFFKIQDAYCVNAIKDFWEKTRRCVIQQLQSKGPVVLLGDATAGGPGLSARYCTYSAVENDSKKIVSLVNLDRRETQLSSVAMERMGFIRTLDRLTQELQVLEICTDARSQISALFNDGKYKDCGVTHSLDMWHGAKSLGRKIHAAGQLKGCSRLRHWTKHICNHFWHCCKTADSFNSFLELWIAVLHHVVGESHHGPLVETSAKVWLEKNSLAYQKLREIVLDSCWLKNIHQYLPFRSTAELESFHNHVLMYAGQRFSFSPPVYSARTMLAALDYNHHVNRPAKRKADGSLHFNLVLSPEAGLVLVLKYGYSVNFLTNYF